MKVRSIMEHRSIREGQESLTKISTSYQKYKINNNQDIFIVKPKVSIIFCSLGIISFFFN